MAPVNPSSDFNQRLLHLLVCPLTKGPLFYKPELQELWSPHANVAYPVKEGVPILLADEARQLDDQEKKQL